MDGLNGVTPVNGSKDTERVEKTATVRKPESISRALEGDSTELTLRAQAEASRSQPEPDRRSADWRDVFKGEPVLSAETARIIGDPGTARDTTLSIIEQILAQPADAAQAQANSAGQGVLTLLR